MLVFLSVALVVLGGSLAYLARRSLALCPCLARHPAWVWAFFACGLFLFLLVHALQHTLPIRLEVALTWLAYGLLGLVTTFFAYLLVADLAQFLARRCFHAPEAFACRAWGTAAALALASSLLGLWNVLRPVPLETHEVRIAGLPKGLEGFRIVQISDLHIGPVTRNAALTRLVAQVNALEPDLVAVTGDLVDGRADGSREKLALLSGIQARHGVFFVTGNHEYYAGAGPWLQAIRGLGWRILLNSHAEIARNDATLSVLGLPDPAAQGARGGGRGPDLAKAMAGVPPEACKVLLFHQPLGFREAEASGVNLQLSGHTHGGQYFPWNLVVQATWRYATGLNRHGRMWIHTSRGTGTWGPPNRFLVPPELTLLVLRREEP